MISGNSSNTPISDCTALHEWMAPEQLCGKAADKPGDVFSFGVMIWECATSRRPFDKITNFKEILRKKDPRIKEIPKKWSVSIVVLIKDCLKAAEDRPSFEQV